MNNRKGVVYVKKDTKLLWLIIPGVVYDIK